MTQYNPQTVVNAEVREYFDQVFGKEEFDRILKRLSFPSLKTWLRINTTITSPQDVLKELKDFEEFNPRLQERISRVITLQGTGPINVSFSDDLVTKEVMISRKTAESVLRGSFIFAPGILATSAGLSKGETVVVYVANEDTIHYTRGSVLSPKECQNKQLLFAGIGTSHMSRTELFRSHTGLAITLTEPVFKSPCCNGLLRGKLMLQNLPSIVTAQVLDPKPGWIVLDMCAAPGGKTTAIAELMQNTGSVFALDRTHKKVKRIADLANELNLTCIYPYKLDATKALYYGDVKDTTQNQSKVKLNTKELARKTRKEAFRVQCKQQPIPEAVSMQQSNGFPAGFFDGILLDAPCSALGLRPRLHFPHTLTELQETAHYQRRLLDAAVPLMKEGGVLVYSTCTINPMENEANVQYALMKYPCLVLEAQSPVLGRTGLSCSANGEDQWLSPDQASLLQRFDPCDFSLDSIGFFIAKFSKRTVS